MRAQTLVATLVLGSGIAAGATVFVPALAAQASGGTGQAPWLTLHEVQLRLAAMGYRDLTKIQREGHQIEISATDPQGRRVDVDVDSVTGDILDTEVRRSRPATTENGRASWLTMHQVQVKLEALGYRDIVEIDRERDRYEAKATDAQGQRVKLAVAPRSGDIVSVSSAKRAGSIHD